MKTIVWKPLMIKNPNFFRRFAINDIILLFYFIFQKHLERSSNKQVNSGKIVGNSFSVNIIFSFNKFYTASVFSWCDSSYLNTFDWFGFFVHQPL